MMTKKIKIMLAAFINYPNAQNINCDNIAKYLDKTKFDVHCLYLGGRPVDIEEYRKKGITLHYVNQHRVGHQITLLRALIFGNYDIYYMPKVDKLFRWFARHYKDKRLLVSSVEGVITAHNLSESSQWYKEYMLRDMYDIFSISHCIADSVEKYYGRKTEILPLGVRTSQNTDVRNAKESIKRIIWTGSFVKGKRPQLLLELAKIFPEKDFIMIGDGALYDEIRQRIIEEGIDNITLTGRISNTQVYEYMENADLLLMTSEFEGLPKVIQEAAQCGVPSIYMANNYTVDFIQNGVSGYEVYSLDEMQETIQLLSEHPAIYQEVSQKAKKAIEVYSWDKLIARYENWFESRVRNYKTEKVK